MRVNPVRTKVLITNGCLNHHHSMMPRRAAIGTYTLVLIAIIAVAAISIVFVASQSSTTSTTTQSSSLSQSTITSHPPATSTTSVSSSNGNTTSTICVVNVEGAGTYLQIVSDSTQQPLSGISVSVLPTASSCLGYPPIPGPETYTTNATGWVSMGGLQANYYFETSLTYTGRNYSFVLPQGPIETTNATLSLPSGTLSISLCNATGTKTCSPYSASTTTNTSTQTAYSATEVSSKLRTSIANDIWNFTVSINTNSPEQGQSVQLMAELTNIGSTSQEVSGFAGPFINPEVYAANGTEVWAWNPPYTTVSASPIASGQTLSQNVSIPTSQLSAGQTYTIEVVPLFITTQSNLTITMQFSVG